MMQDERFATTPKPPFYAVIFSSTRTAGEQGYGEMAQRMVELAAQQPGYLGVVSARGADGFGITVSYWSDPAAVRAWKEHAEHVIAQEQGCREWYQHYELRVARVERAYAGPEATLHPVQWDSGN
jgi:heme-degrading monooxygenase HmoA